MLELLQIHVFLLKNMQIYNGASRRVLRKLKSGTNTGFRVDGHIGQEEERAIYVRQKFSLKQYESGAPDDVLLPMSLEWVFPEEKDDFNHHEGNDPANAKRPTPFTGKHVLTDRLLLNKTFSDMSFKPYGAHNFLKVENVAQAQMAPLLCSKKQFENVTVAPIVKGLSPYEVQDTVNVPLSMYGRYWFGSLHNMPVDDGGLPTVPNRIGFAPYFVEDEAAAVAPMDDGVGNPEIYSAYGFTPGQMEVGQELRPRGVQEVLEDHTGYISFEYDSTKDVYRSRPFEVTIPWPLNQGEFHDEVGIETHETFTVPSIETNSTDLVTVRSDEEPPTPYNYFKIKRDNEAPAGPPDDLWESHPRKYLPRHADDEIVYGVPEVRNESRNSLDFIPIKLARTNVKIVASYDNGAAQYPAVGEKGGEAGAETELYMFIPIFRICKGNKYASPARARRFAGNTTLVVAQPWRQSGNEWSFRVPAGTPVEEVFPILNGGGTTLTEQAPFWAFYESTKWMRQHVSLDQWATLVEQAGYKQPPEQFLLGATQLWDMEKIGHITVHTPQTNTPMICIEFKYAPDLSIAAQHYINTVIYPAVVTNRRDNAGAFQAQNTQIVFAYRDRRNEDKNNAFSTEPKGYFVLRLDQCNTFRTAGGDQLAGFDLETYATPAGANPTIAAGAAAHQAFRETLWQIHKRVQIEITAVRGGFTLNEQVSPFRNEALYNKAIRMPEGDANGNAAAQAQHAARNAAITASVSTPANKVSGKPLETRSVYNFLQQESIYNSEHVTTFPQVQGPGPDAGLLGDDGFFKFADGNMELFLPVRRPLENHFAGTTEVTVECVEPFFGHITGTSQLRCQHPLDTSKHGKNWPITVQNYKYNYSRAGSPVVDQLSGFIKDSWATLEITSEDSPEFTCISETLPGVNQGDKHVMRLNEITATLDTFEKQYSPGETATVEFETRSGMFEYLFLHCKYVRSTDDFQSPEHDPVITQLRFKVRGRENQFVRTLDQFDLERLSRQNCHALCDWRTLHDHGQGVLLHLSDVGLTEEVPFPERKRIQLEVTLLADTTEQTTITAVLEDKRLFKVVVVRQNQLLTSNWEGARFSFVNEN